MQDVSARTASARFAVVDFRDYAERTGDDGDYPAKVDVPFTSDPSEAVGAIQDLTLGYGGDTPETMFSGLAAAYDRRCPPSRSPA